MNRLKWRNRFLLWLGTICASSLIFGGIIGGTLFAACRTCHQQTQNIGFPAKWGVWSGCMIEVNGSWIPLENYRYFGEE